MDSWIYIVIFIVVPIISRIIEMNKARAEKAAAEAKRMMRKESRRNRQRARDNETVADPGAPAPASGLDDPGWIRVGNEPPVAGADPVSLPDPNLPAPEPPPGPGGWVKIPEPAPQPAISNPDLQPQLPKGLEIFTFPMAEEPIIEDVPGDPVRAEEAFHLAPDQVSAAYLSRNLPGHSPQLVSPRNRFRRITREELRDRLIWREILGPPLCLREHDS